MSIVDEGLADAVKAYEAPKKPSLALSTSTGVVSLDRALGGALPSGAIEIYGPASAGKTSLLFEVISTAQRHGWLVALCPSEYLDLPYMRHLGVDLNSLLLITGNTGEWVLEGALRFIDNHRGRRVLLALDSATGLRPEEDEFGSWNLMIDTFLEEALPALGPHSSVVMTNQSRTRKSIRPERFFVDGDIDSTAKKIIDRFSSRIELSRANVTDSQFTLMVNIVANAYSRPGHIVEIPFSKGDGVDTIRDLIRVAVESGAIEVSGTWYSFDGTSLGQGEGQSTAVLEMNQELASRVLDRVMKEA